MPVKYQSTSQLETFEISSGEGRVTSSDSRSFCSVPSSPAIRILVIGLLCSVSTVIFFSATNAKHNYVNSHIEIFSESTAMAEFSQFVKKFLKTYGTDEETTVRFKIFQDNLIKVQQYNNLERQNGGSGRHGITKFSDLTAEEFKGILGSSKVDLSSHGHMPLHSAVKMGEISGSKNWVGIYTSAVKDSGGVCGADWAFSIVEQIESDAIRLGVAGVKINTPLSTQQIISCFEPMNYGCFSGDMFKALDWIVQNRGLVSESSYPYSQYYSETVAACQPKSDPIVTLLPFPSTSYPAGSISANKGPMSMYAMTFASESDLATYVLQQGPVAAYMNSNYLQFYEDGILSSCPPGDQQLDHGVQIVGVNIDKNDASNSYWIVRNSVGDSDFGMDGYFYVKYGVKMCGIDSFPFYTNPTAPIGRAAKILSPPSTKPTQKPKANPTSKPVVKPTSKPTGRPVKPPVKTPVKK